MTSPNSSTVTPQSAHQPSIEQLLEFAHRDGLQGEEIDFDDGTRIQEVHISRLLPDPKNARKTMAAICEMEQSIKARKKILTALHIRRSEHDGQAVVDRGNRRYLGAILRIWQADAAGQEWSPLVPCRVLIDEDSDLDRQIDNMVDNLEREKIPEREEAIAYQELMDAHQCDVKALAERFGGRVSEAHITSRLCLLNLATLQEDGFEVLQHYLDGRISLTDAQQLGRLPRQQQRGLSVQIARKELVGRELAQEVSRLLGTAKYGSNRLGRPTETTGEATGHGMTSLGTFGSRMSSVDGNGHAPPAYEKRVRTWCINANTPNQIDVSFEQTADRQVQLKISAAGVLTDEVVGAILAKLAPALKKTEPN